MNFVKIIIVLVFTVLLSFSIPIVSAKHEVNAGVTVDHLPGFIDKLTEGLNLLLRFSGQSKIDYSLYLLDKRLAEINFVLKNDDIDSLEITSSRYLTHVGRLIKLTEENKSLIPKDKLLSMYDKHTVHIEDLQKKFEYDSGWWIMLQHNINLLKEGKEKIQ